MTGRRHRASSPSTLESVFVRGARLKRAGVLRRIRHLQVLIGHAILSFLKRKAYRLIHGVCVPIAITLSPTMRCNLDCEGCYARDYPNDHEMPLSLIDEVFGTAQRMGVFLMIISGGEPLMREGIIDLLRKHSGILYLLVTNGTLLDERTAQEIARASNIVPVVSLEGSPEQTDARRGRGVYEAVLGAMSHLKHSDILFGFSVMVTRDNLRMVSSNEFIDDMIDRGCSLGFYTEYIPIGTGARPDLVLDRADRAFFRERLLEIRRDKPIMIAHLPDDEYTRDGRCMAVAGGCIHVNSQGYAEPCPFAHFASDNVRSKGLREILRSEFLAGIRSSTAVFRTGGLGCALLENAKTVEEIAAATGAKRTDCRT